jgi:hypothetical protein
VPSTRCTFQAFTTAECTLHCMGEGTANLNHKLSGRDSDSTSRHEGRQRRDGADDASVYLIESGAQCVLAELYVRDSGATRASRPQTERGRQTPGRVRRSVVTLRLWRLRCEMCREKRLGEWRAKGQTRAKWGKLGHP